MALIPTDRIPHGGWVPGVNVGVIGGIPSRTTIADDDGFGLTESLTSIDDTATDDVIAAIQAACDAAGSGEVVRLPEGEFRCNATLNLGTAFNGKTLRGAGRGLTKLIFYANQGINAGSSSGYYVPIEANRVLVTDGLEAGSTEITVSGDISYITAGSVIKLNFPNRLTPLFYSVYLFNVNTDTSPSNQVVKVISKVGSVLEFFPPLECDHTGEEVRVHTQSVTAEGIHIEDLTVDMVNHTTLGGSYSGISMHQVTGGVIRNCKAVNSLNYGIIMANCVNSEIRGCWAGELKGLGSNGAGLLFAGWACWVENNAFVHAFPGLEANNGCSRNVFSYNFSNGSWNTNHAPHNRFNLHEGCSFHHQISDGYFGSESDLTLYRCYGYSISVNLRRFNRNTTVSCCILSNQIGCGLPFIASGDSYGTAQLSAADPWRDYEMAGELTTRTSDTVISVTVTTGGKLNYHVDDLHRVYLYWGTNNENAIIGDVTAWSAPVCTLNIISGIPPAEDTIFGAIGPGSHGGHGVPEDASYPELDLDVEATLDKKGNYYVDSETTDSLAGETMVDSLIYEEAPDWWPVEMEWPPFDPTDPSTADYTRLPVGLEFSETEPPAAPEITTNPTTTGSPTQGQTLTAVSGTVTGNPPPAITWQWQFDDGGGFEDIPGATSISYPLDATYIGDQVRVAETATNSISPFTDTAYSTPVTITAFMGDIHTLVKTSNSDPVTMLVRRAAIVAGVGGTLADEVITGSTDYPFDFDLDYDYAPVNGSGDRYMVADGTVSLGDFQSYRDSTDPL